MPTYRTVDTLTESQIVDLVELYRHEFWSQQRQQADVVRMLAETDLMIGLVDESDRLAGFTRVLTDFVYRAVIFDVIVRPSDRGQGLGARLIDTVIQHPRLQTVETLALCCLSAMTPFYQRWGFTEYPGGMRILFRDQAS